MLTAKGEHLLERGTIGDSSANEAAFADHALTTRRGVPSDYENTRRTPDGLTDEDWRHQCYISDVVLDWSSAPAPRVRDIIDVRRPLAVMGSPRRQGFVYFIGAEDGPIKIGFTADLKARLSKLGTGSAKPLSVLASIPGTPVDEGNYHAMFRRHRLNGEWFERTPRLLAEIRRLRKKGAALPTIGPMSRR